MRVAVIGAGNVGSALAIHLSLGGHEVRLCTRSEQRLRPIREGGGLTATGAVQGSAPIALLTTSLPGSRPPRSPMSQSEVAGNVLGTPWKANLEGPPKTKASPDSRTMSHHGRLRFSVLPKRNTQLSPTLSDTTGAELRSSRS